MPRGNKRASTINSSPRGRPRGRGGHRSRGRGRGSWSASPVYDHKSIGRPVNVDNEEEEKRKRRALRFKDERWRTPVGSGSPDSSRPAFTMSPNRRLVSKYPAADRFLRDFLIRQATDVAKIKTLPRYINIPKSGPRHQAHDFFINLPYLQRLSDYGNAEFIMKAELQAQKAEISDIMRSRGPRLKISAEGSPIPVHVRLARPLPIRTDSDIEMAEAGPLTESPTTVSAPAPAPAPAVIEISSKKANAYSTTGGIREDLSPMDVDEDYPGSHLRSLARARRTSLNANTNTRRPSRRVSFTGTQELIDRGDRDRETVESPSSEYARNLQFEATVITEEPEDVDGNEAVPGTPGVYSNRSFSLDDKHGSSKATSPKLPKQKRDIPDSLNPMVFNMRTRTYASWATNSCALSDCPFHAHKQPKWVHDMLVNPPTFYF